MQPFVTQYQSANLSDEQIIDNFVVRTKEFARVIADIRTTDKSSSFQHYVFVGRRGSGKSTLLRRIQAEVGTDPELNAQFIVANLSEEQAGVYKLYDLWDYVMRDLRAKGFELPEIDWQQYQDDLKEYTKVLYRAIHDFLQQQDKRLILLVDNIDRIFKNIGKDASLLREQLMNFNDVRIIGGSTVMAEDFWRYDMPFYQFFSIKRLEPLTMEEIKMLLEHWAAARGNPEIAKFVERHPGKIQAVRMLTDGTPRTMQLFVDMLINRDDQQGFDYLRRIIDNATPIYQERLAQLSHQQQKIVTELSFFWEAASVEQLVPVCKMTGKNISAQMAQLVKARIVEKVKGEKKNMYYRLEERFFNLWLLMTQGGPQQKKEAKYLTVFLEAWYDREEILQIQKEHLGHLKGQGKRADYLAIMTKALAHSKHINVIQREGMLAHTYVLPKLSEKDIQELPELISRTFMNVDALINSNQMIQAARILKSAHHDEFKVVMLYFTRFVEEDRFQYFDPFCDAILVEKFPLRFVHFCIANLNYLTNGDKQLALEFINREQKLGDDPMIWLEKAKISLWAGEMETFEFVMNEHFKDIMTLQPIAISEFMIELLVHKQYNRVMYEYTEGEQNKWLRTSAPLPVFAAALLRNPGAKLNDRFPPEAAQIVSDIVAKVKELQEFYYGK